MEVEECIAHQEARRIHFLHMCFIVEPCIVRVGEFAHRIRNTTHAVCEELHRDANEVLLHLRRGFVGKDSFVTQFIFQVRQVELEGRQEKRAIGITLERTRLAVKTRQFKRMLELLRNACNRLHNRRINGATSERIKIRLAYFRSLRLGRIC